MAKRELRLARLLKRFAKFRPLIIDDIGYVQQDREEMEVLFTLLAERLRTRQHHPHEQFAVFEMGEESSRTP